MYFLLIKLFNYKDVLKIFLTDSKLIPVGIYFVNSNFLNFNRIFWKFIELETLLYTDQILILLVFLVIILLMLFSYF